MENTANGINLVVNPGFEMRGSNAHEQWYRDLNQTANKGKIVRVKYGKYLDNHAIRMKPTSANDEAHPLSIAQEIPIQNILGETVEISGKLSARGGAVALIGVMTLVNGKTSPFEWISHASNSGEWVHKSMPYTIPTDPSTKLYLSLIVSGKTGSVSFDDIRIISKSTEATDQGSTGTDQLHATITIDADSITRQIPDAIFGANIEWPWNATGLWDEKKNRVDKKAEQLTKALGIKLIRFPGGIDADFYHWRDGIGPRDQRPKVKYRAGDVGKTRPNFGTDEALAFAESIGGELLITVNAGTGTPEEAADWVRYVNKDELRVRFWEVGNELYINSPEPHASEVTITPKEYADRFIAFAEAMKKADPRIQIGAIGGLNEGSYQQISYPNWNKILFRKAGDYIDFLAVHNAYAPILTGDERNKTVRDVYRAMLGRPVSIAKNLQRQAKQLEAVYPDAAQRPFIAVTEWGPIFQFFHAGEYVDHPKTLGSAIFSASTFNALLKSPETEISAFWMLNDFSSLGWIASANDRFPPDPEWQETARYYAYQMYTQHFGRQLIKTEVTGPTFNTPKVGWSDALKSVPYLDVITSLGPNNETLYILVINKHFDEAISADINISNAATADQGTQWQLTGKGLDSHTGTKVINVPWIKWGIQKTDKENPRFNKRGADEITISDTMVTGLGNNFTHSFPPLSITSLEIPLE
ncbi:MAG: hypothetical protein MI754_15555 [Chromatiales bacterium]|nr:hypothetical protein [Chromatiales bacterium]